MYEYGVDVPENRIEAVKWFRLAAANGMILATNHLKSLESTEYSKPIAHKNRPTPAITNNDPLNIRD